MLCGQCGLEFAPKNRQQRYCSQQCRWDAKNGRRKHLSRIRNSGEQLEVLSLGAGVQSSTVLMMSIRGDLPRVDYAVFSDTGWEGRRVYEWMDSFLLPEAEKAGIEVLRVESTVGRLQDRWWEMPLFVRKDDGEVVKVGRQCTGKYKIWPVKRAIRQLLDGDVRIMLPDNAVRQWIGISWDESHRMRDSDTSHLENYYPLVDLRMTREDCHQWMRDHGYPEPPRSSCVGCPFHSDAEWRRIRQDPEDWKSVVAVDRLMRTSEERGGLIGTPYLHRSGLPIEEIDFGDAPAQFDEECQGMCGV